MKISPLILLQKFDIIHGFNPDYMHSVLLGVVKRITERLLGTGKRNKSKLICELNEKIKTIKVPYQLAQYPRPLSERHNWKAKEWENWLLYYSLPVFKGLIDQKFIDYWALLVERMFILLKTNITRDDVQQADCKLIEFVLKTEKFFKIREMTFNMHCLLHLAKSVYNWGPL